MSLVEAQVAKTCSWRFLSKPTSKSGQFWFSDHNFRGEVETVSGRQPPNTARPPTPPAEEFGRAADPIRAYRPMSGSATVPEAANWKTYNSA